jgi:catechol 2,3-dioxygenase-like lactoylglutathione lyase family enzyme
VRLTLRPRGRRYDGPQRNGSAGVHFPWLDPERELDAGHAELLQKQVEVLEPPHDWEYGHRTLFFKDPEGNILEIYADS